MIVTILEFVNEYGNFEFSGVYTGGGNSPERAIKRYLEENNLPEEDNKIQIDGSEAWVDDVCRAYITTTEKI